MHSTTPLLLAIIALALCGFVLVPFRYWPTIRPYVNSASVLGTVAYLGLLGMCLKNNEPGIALALILAPLVIFGFLRWATSFARKDQPTCPVCGGSEAVMISSSPEDTPEVGEQVFRQTWSCPCGKRWPVDQVVSITPTVN